MSNELNEQQKKTVKQISDMIMNSGRFSGRPNIEVIDSFAMAFVVMMDLYEKAEINIELPEMEQMYYRLNPID